MPKSIVSSFDIANFEGTDPCGEAHINFARSNN